ncbi:MAG TPA: hypothetical protein VFE97_06625 [Methylomirabilota bacterium]|nr:hypothetical protein [Methylomirabilota bacterium]
MHAVGAFVRTEECGAASTLTMAGVSQRDVIAMLGHRDPRMTIRYQHLSPEHLYEARAHWRRVRMIARLALFRHREEEATRN